jgi:hypothetical protein
MIPTSDRHRVMSPQARAAVLLINRLRIDRILAANMNE